MDPWTLAYLAGHRDMNITKRYVHPQPHTILDAMEKAWQTVGTLLGTMRNGRQSRRKRSPDAMN